MGMLGRFFGGLTGKAKEDFGHGNALFVPYMNVYKNVVAAPNACEQVEVRVGETQNKIVAGDIMFTQSSETVEEIGFASVWLSNHTPYLNSFCFAFRIADQTSILPLWFAYFMRSANVRKTIMREGQGITRVNLSSERMKAIALAIPCESEQQKIAAVFSLLDSKITAQRKLVKLLKKHKRGVMEQIFGRRLNMGENSEKWDIVELRDLFTKVARRNREGKIKNVITNSAEFGLIPQRDFFDKSIAVDGNTDGYYVIRTGDFVYNPRKSTTAPFGPFNRYTGIEDGIISPLYTCLVPKGKANPEYLAWYFRSTAWHRYVYDNGSQGARHDRVNMTDDLLFGIPVLLPPIAVQERIADGLNAVDARWHSANKMLEKLECMKRGLLQQLFT